MAKKKSTTKEKETKYRVLIPCGPTRDGRQLEPGDMITDKGFSAFVIKNWLEIAPPVLEEV